MLNKNIVFLFTRSKICLFLTFFVIYGFSPEGEKCLQQADTTIVSPSCENLVEQIKACPTEINEQDKILITTLNNAIKIGFEKCVQEIVRYTNFEKMSQSVYDDIENPLNVAVQFHLKKEIFQILVQKKIDKEIINGKTFPLFEAAKNNSVDYVKILLENKANPNRWYRGKTPLDVTTNTELEGLLNSVTKISKLKTDFDAFYSLIIAKNISSLERMKKTIPIDWNYFNDDGDSFMHAAVLADNAKLAMEIYELNPSLFTFGNNLETSPAEIAYRDSKIEILKVFISRIPNLDFLARIFGVKHASLIFSNKSFQKITKKQSNEMKKSLLELAELDKLQNLTLEEISYDETDLNFVLNYNYENFKLKSSLIRFLLSEDVHLCAIHEKIILRFAIDYEDNDLLLAVLQNHHHPETKKTIFNYALKNRVRKILDLFLSDGCPIGKDIPLTDIIYILSECDVSIGSLGNYGSVMYWVEKASIDKKNRDYYLSVVEKIIKKGANINETNSKLPLSLNYAVLQKDFDLIQRLLKMGADKNIVDGTSNKNALQETDSISMMNYKKKRKIKDLLSK